ncbi:MAG TPA: peptidase M15 [Gemmatimonadetes bacterium]|jgi:uncharacterized protein YcbK (DUF882 family)|nr:peptidase M15 [Gemmatimonadota bacterium]
MLITPNFSSDEMACNCCGKSDMDGEFMKMLQQLREDAGFAFRISSARRCEAHDSNVSSYKKSKAGIHTYGKAVDILVGHVNTTKTLKLIKQAQDIGFTGMGLALRGARPKRFIHLDNRGVDFSLPAVWTY